MPKLSQEEIKTRFTYHSPKDGQTEKYEAIRELAKNFAEFINDVCPEFRETSLAMTNLEQAVMWANASIARRE